MKKIEKVVKKKATKKPAVKKATPSEESSPEKPAQERLINMIVTQGRFDLDRAYSCWLAKGYGENLYPGIKDASINFVKGDPDVSETYCSEKKIFPIGLRGTNLRPREGSVTGKLARLLGIKRGSPPFILGKEVHRRTGVRGVSKTELPELVKTAFRTMKDGGNSDTIMKWTHSTFDVIAQYLSLPLENKRVALTSAFFQRAVESGKYKDGHVQNFILASLKDSEKKTSEFMNNPAAESALLEVDFVVRAMQIIGRKSQEIYEFLFFVFDRLQAEQQMFVEAEEECKKEKNRSITRAMIGGKRFGLKTMILHGDNPMFLPAANKAWQNLVMIRNKAGQVQIFLHSKNKKLNLDMVAFFIRWFELPKEMRVRANHRALATMDVYPGIEQWYYDRKKRRLFNGSHTNPGVPPTGISSQALFKIITNSFDPNKINYLKKKCGIETSRPRPKKLSEATLDLERKALIEQRNEQAA